MNRLFIAFVAVGLLASVYVALLRYSVEQRNRAVEVAVDYEEVTQLAACSGKTTVEVLRAMHEAGASSCAVSAYKLRDALDEGMLIRTGHSTFLTTPELADQIVKWLGAELPAQRGKIGVRPAEAGKVTIEIDMPWSYAQQLSIGLGNASEDAKAAQLSLIARIPNYKGASPQTVDALLRLIKEAGSNQVIFDGEQVLGFRGAEKETGEAFVKNGMYYGMVEFAKQKGSQKLAMAAQSNLVVVHSITQAEMPNLTVQTIRDRFVKAVRERGVRVCYVRMYYNAGPDLLDANVNYIEQIAGSIQKAGYNTQLPAHPIDDLVVPVWARVLAGAAVAAGMVLLVISVVSLHSHVFSIMTVLVFLVCITGATAGATGRSFIALFAALSFPTLGALWSVSRIKSVVSRPTIAQIVGRLCGAVLIAVCGGLLVVGLLSERAFMLRLDTFMGVKAAHFLPVLLLAVLFAGGVGWGAADWEVQKNKLLSSFRNVAANPILVWQAAGAVLVLILLGLMVARSGNDSGLGVSMLEMKFRSILDKVLYVRPRTKEFLIGYPALFCGIGFALRGYKNWAVPFILLGCFGLVSALNTFCHIHTPIALTAMRVFNGLWLGTLIGWIVYRLIRFSPGKAD